MNMYKRSRCPPSRTALFERIHGRNRQVFRSQDRSLAFMRARALLLRLSGTSQWLRCSSISEGCRPSLLISPRPSVPRETLFLGGHAARSFSRARLKGHGPWAGAQNRGSTRERPDARKLTRTRSCVHEPLRKSPLDRCWPLPPSLSLPVSRSPLFRVAKPDIRHRKMSIFRHDGSHVTNWSYRKKWHSFVHKLWGPLVYRYWLPSYRSSTFVAAVMSETFRSIAHGIKFFESITLAHRLSLITKSGSLK